MKKNVEIGQTYQSVGKPILTWQVAKIVDQAGIPHARLVSPDGREQRLVACSVIGDNARYRMVREAPQPDLSQLGRTVPESAAE